MLVKLTTGPIQNVTVNVGREAVLECPVNSLGQYKVKTRLRISGSGEVSEEMKYKTSRGEQNIRNWVL